jgi:hypothetical protein
MCAGRVAVTAPLVAPIVFLLDQSEHQLIWKSCWTPVYVMSHESERTEL